ncbi:MAG: NnrU family protein [Alcanivoracaceae bacterium]|nr:NnrU family protein [Alcanivoracaceae bacterium]
MLMLVIGLILFLGMHSANMLAPGLRAGAVARIGVLPWKGFYALVAIAGLVLVVLGYGEARMQPTWLWTSPVWTRHLAALLMLPVMILLVATYVPGTRIKARIGHPMLLATKIWALAHLFANGAVHEVILFGSFLVWAVFGFIVYRKRDRASGKQYPVASVGRDILAVVIGVVFWALFSFHLHRMLFGVGPFG